MLVDNKTIPDGRLLLGDNSSENSDGSCFLSDMGSVPASEAEAE